MVQVGDVIRRPWSRNPRYLVGDDGTIIGPSGRVLKLQIGTHGYLQVSVVADGDPRYRAHPVHRMVCETFHGPRPKGMQAAHWDGDPHNNAARNLRWATQPDNTQDSIRHGTFAAVRNERIGEEHHLAVLTEDRVREIRAAYADGLSVSALARKYGVANNTIRQVLEGITWKHVT